MLVRGNNANISKTKIERLRNSVTCSFYKPHANMYGIAPFIVA